MPYLEVSQVDGNYLLFLEKGLYILASPLEMSYESGDGTNFFTFATTSEKVGIFVGFPNPGFLVIVWVFLKASKGS